MVSSIMSDESSLNDLIAILDKHDGKSFATALDLIQMRMSNFVDGFPIPYSHFDLYLDFFILEILEKARQHAPDKEMPHHEEG